MATRKTIGIREFKNRATQVVREVREERASYVITVDGEPAAVLEPIAPERDVEEWRRQALAWLDEFEEWGRSISGRWPKGLDAVEAVREQRREL